MPSQFFGLTIAGSGLSTYQAAINTTANNISNEQTEGYSRQINYTQPGEALRVSQRYGTVGTGVVTTAIKQLRNEYYDQKYWENQTSLGYYSGKVYYMKQIETYFSDDDKTTGFSSLFNQFRANLDSVGSSPNDSTIRKTFISSCQSLCNYFANVANELEGLQSSLNEEVKSTVENINSISEKIALLNKQINVLEVQGGYANELRDQRALLVDELSTIIPIEVAEAEVVNSNYPGDYVGATSFTIMVQGQTLVDTYSYRTLKCETRESKINQTDIDGLYDIKWADWGNSFDAAGAAMSGKLKSLLEMRDGNNNDNFSAKLSSYDYDATTASMSVTFSGDDLSITSVEEMNMPPAGKITLDSVTYNYDGFTYTTEIGADGKETITSYTFHLVGDDISSTQIRGALGKKCSIGKAIDCMGVVYYQNQMSSFIRAFTRSFNNIERKGVDQDGHAMGTFFVGKGLSSDEEYDFSDYNDAYADYLANGTTSHSYSVYSTEELENNTTITQLDSYYMLTAKNFKVNKQSSDNPTYFSAATSIVNGVEQTDLTVELINFVEKEKLYRGNTSKNFLQCILDDISVDTEETDTFVTNFTNIQTAIQTQRTSISGVDKDEEALNLLKFQNAYNMSSKVISVLSEMYDQLILRTGV